MERRPAEFGLPLLLRMQEKFDSFRVTPAGDVADEGKVMLKMAKSALSHHKRKDFEAAHALGSPSLQDVRKSKAATARISKAKTRAPSKCKRGTVSRA